MRICNIVFIENRLVFDVWKKIVFIEKRLVLTFEKKTYADVHNCVKNYGLLRGSIRL